MSRQAIYVAPPGNGTSAPVVVDFTSSPFALATSGSAFYDLDTSGSAAARNYDVVIPNVQAGDTVMVGLSAVSVSAANGHYITASTIVAGAAVQQPIVSAWFLTSGLQGTPSGEIPITLTEADIENGSVRLRLQGFRQSGSAARSLGWITPSKFWGRGPFR